MQRTGLQDPPVPDHHDLVREHGRLVGIVGYQHRRQSGLVLEAAHLPHQLMANGRIQRRERLVQQDHLGVAADGPGQADPLALTSRELGWEAIQEVFEMKSSQPPGGPGRDGVDGEVGLTPHRSAREKAQTLRHITDMPPLWRDRTDILVAVIHGSGARQQSGQSPEG